MQTKVWMALWCGFMVVACGSCTSDEALLPMTESTPFISSAGERTLFTRYNLHYISELGLHRASYANWTQHPGHRVLPYNTRVRALVGERRIYFVVADTGMTIDFEYNAGRMAMSPWEYLDLITSPTPVTYENLSALDRQGIAAGRARVGMSKQGVLVALGYPARHQTPSLDDTGWTYWKGRRDHYVVEFDQSGNVTHVVNQ